MGCAASRHGSVSSPGYEVASSSAYNVSGSLSASGSASIWSQRPVRLEALDLAAGNEKEEEERRRGRPGEATAVVVARLPRRHVSGEQAAAGWPSWLSAVAAEAVQGWVPLRAEAYEKLEKIGQGTYSSVFRARELATGRAVALKKVRFDSAEPESVRFMAREIAVLRRLRGHPNVVSLDGIVTSRSSSAVYLVFEYMEHDLAGLAASPEVPAFTEPQLKCLMRQLLAGLAHCHARGVMHRDVKCANLLVSKDGELKVADFGLANTFVPSTSATASQPPMTSRVVTLWYRPPELLLGATAYEPSVDLWSAGCVFAEMRARRPVLQGRTEVEQIHKIFKLCGSPPEAFWRRSGLAHAAAFRPNHPYPSRLKDTFASAMPDDAFRLLATLLSLDPAARGTAADALDSDYFTTAPYACEPSSLPKYAPNKEMDAKFREDSRRRSNQHGGEGSRRLSRGHKSMLQLQQDATSQQRHGHVHAEESLPTAPASSKDGGGGEAPRLFVDLQPAAAISKRHPDDAGDAAIARAMSRSLKEQAGPPPPRLAAEVLPLPAGPAQLATSTGFAWAKKPATAATTTKRACPKVPTTASRNEGERDAARTTTAPYEAEKQEMIKQWAQVADAFSASDAHNSSRFTQTVDVKQLKTGKKYKASSLTRVDFSGPLLSQPRRIDELLENHEQQIRRNGRRSWFHKGSKREHH